MPFEADFARFLPSVGNGSSSMRHVRFPLECVADNFKKLVRLSSIPLKETLVLNSRKTAVLYWQLTMTINDYVDHIKEMASQMLGG